MAKLRKGEEVFLVTFPGKPTVAFAKCVLAVEGLGIFGEIPLKSIFSNRLVAGVSKGSYNEPQ